MKQTRSTAQRRLIQELLENNQSHPTAEQIFELAKQKNASISRGTVYRNLNLLSELGEIVRLKMPFGCDHYDSRTSPHYHFLCRTCGNVLDATLPYSESINLSALDIPGCKMESHELTLIGLCYNCNNQPTAT